MTAALMEQLFKIWEQISLFFSLIFSERNVKCDMQGIKVEFKSQLDNRKKYSY